MASQLVSEPMVGFATNYGQQLAQQGREKVCKCLICLYGYSATYLFQINEAVKVSRLKYFFAVDTTYVMKKLGLVMFPFAHSVRQMDFMKLYLVL